jgi:hypothetical protein
MNSEPNQGTEITQAMSPEETSGAVVDRYHLLQKSAKAAWARSGWQNKKSPSAAASP